MRREYVEKAVVVSMKGTVMVRIQGQRRTVCATLPPQLRGEVRKDTAVWVERFTGERWVITGVQQRAAQPCPR